MKFLHVRYSDGTGDVFTVSPDTVMIVVPRGIDHGYKAALEEVAADGRVTLVFGSRSTRGRAVRARSLEVGEEAYARDLVAGVKWLRLRRLSSGPTAKRTAAKRNPRSPTHGYVIEALHLGVWSREGIGDKIVFSSQARAEKALRSLISAYRHSGQRVDPKGFRVRKVAERPDAGY